MEGIRQEDFEVTVAFTLSGKKLFEYTEFKQTRVEIPQKNADLLRQYDNLILLHNHPVIEQASFSIDDLEFLARYSSAYGVIVSKNDSYVVSPLGKQQETKELKKIFEQNKNCSEGIWVVDNGELHFIRLTNQRIMETIADQCGMKYYQWNTSAVSSEEIATALLGD